MLTPTRDELHAQADALWRSARPDDIDANRYSMTASWILQEISATSRRAAKWIETLHRYEDHWRMLGRAPRENTRARTTLGDEERRLGEWARYQRRFEDQLNAYQRARLDVSPAFDWDPLESVWRTNLAACVTFVKDMGDLPRLNGEDAREFALACLDDASESACVKIGKRACKHRVARVAAQ
ncbi:hypothetical protein [Microbacterium luteum]|uniref:hypothetical protein n=1 Tax=Microbacterium luteum TaxID=2782167 RepID=UPI001888BDE2|nr:hypothetical protein [Microbacterium luteum]